MPDKPRRATPSQWLNLATACVRLATVIVRALTGSGMP